MTRPATALKCRCGIVVFAMSGTDCSASLADSEPISISCLGEKTLMLWPAPRSKSTPKTKCIIGGYCMEFCDGGEIIACSRALKGMLPNAAGEETPLLGKEGWTRHKEKCREATFEGADGVVRSTTDNSWLEPTTPSA